MNDGSDTTYVGDESGDETKTLEKIKTYTGELKDFFNETKDNFKNIFFELIINTRSINEDNVDDIRFGTDYLVNPSNIKSNFSKILDTLKFKDNLMEVLKIENTNLIDPEGDNNLIYISQKFDIDEYQKSIDDLFTENTDNGELYSGIIYYIDLFIKLLFHKIGNKLNEDIKSNDNASSFAEYKKKFAYNTTTEFINSKLKNIIYEFLDFDNDDEDSDLYNEGKSIFLINDCADLNFAKNLTDKDYYKKKQKVKALLNTNKQYVDESFYRILNETIEALINIQNDKLIQSDATKTMTDILKISAERFLEKYNLVGKIFIKAVGRINKTTQELDNDNYLELEANSNNDLKKFDDDNRIFTKIADLLFISSNKSYMLGLGSAMGDSAIRGRDRHLFFPDPSVHDQPEGWGNTGALKSYITSIASGLGATAGIIRNSRSKIYEVGLDTGAVMKSRYEKLKKSREDASASRQARIIEKNRARDDEVAAATLAAQEERAAAGEARARAADAAARMAEAVRAATAARAAADAEAAAEEAAKREVEAAETALNAATAPGVTAGAAERAAADMATERVRAARAAADALPDGPNKIEAVREAEAAERERVEAVRVAEAAERRSAGYTEMERLRDAQRKLDDATLRANRAKVLAEQKKTEKVAAEREATVAAANRKKTDEAARKAAEKANAEEREKRNKIISDAKVEQEAAKTREAAAAAAVKATAVAQAAAVKATAVAQAAAVKAEVEREAEEAYQRALDFVDQKISERQDATTVNTYQLARDRVVGEVKGLTRELNNKRQIMDNAESEKKAAAMNLDQVNQDKEVAIVNVRQKKKDESDAKADMTKAEREMANATEIKDEKNTIATDLRGLASSASEEEKEEAERKAAVAEAQAQEAEEQEKKAISKFDDARLRVQRAGDAVARAEQAEVVANDKLSPASQKLQDKERAEEAARVNVADAKSALNEKEIELERLMQRAAEEKALPTKLLKDVEAARKARNKLFDKTLESRRLRQRLRRMVGRDPLPSAAPTVGGGSINDSISNVENTYNMIGGLKLDINPKFRRDFSTKARSRNYADDPVAVDNFIMYFLEITFGLQLLLKRLFSGNDISQILRDFFSLYVKKLYTVLKPNISANTKLPIIVSNYSIYEITRKIIFSCFEKFIKENILINDTSASEDSSDLDLSKDITLVKLSFSLPQLVDFFVESFTNLDNLDNNILKPGSNNALINYYNLKLGNVFNTSVEKKEDFALISDELTKIFKITDEDKKETNHLKFYREKIHKIDKIINDHEDETFGLLIEQIQKIIPGFAITENGLLFESTEFNDLTIETKQSDLEKRRAELKEELAEIESKLTAGAAGADGAAVADGADVTDDSTE